MLSSIIVTLLVPYCENTRPNETLEIHRGSEAAHALCELSEDFYNTSMKLPRSVCVC